MPFYTLIVSMNVLINTSELHWYCVVIPVCLLLIQIPLLSFLVLCSLFLSQKSRKKKEIWFLVQASASEVLICGRNRSSMFLTSDDTSFQKAAWKDLKGSISQMVAALVMLLVRQQELPSCSKKAETIISWLTS